MTTAESSPIITTPVHNLVHPETNSQITLVGMIHYADPAYYSAVQQTVGEATASGAIVHYELVQKAPREVVAALPQQAGKKLAMLHDFMASVDEGMRGLNVVRQMDALYYYPQWENHDTDDLDIASRIPYLTLKRHHIAGSLFKTMFSHMDRDQKSKMIGNSLSRMEEREVSRTSNTTAQDLVKTILFGNMDACVLDYRNNIALQAVDGQLIDEPEKDFALIWGSAHLPGITTGLMRRGYRMLHNYRLPALDTRKL